MAMSDFATDGSHLGSAPVGESPVWFALPDPVLHVETQRKSGILARNVYAELTGVDQVWDKYNRGSGVKVGIVDTGADACHVRNKFKGRVTAKDFTGSRSGWQAVNWHGQHCMGIINYVLPECQFIVGKGLNDNGQGADTWLANALRYCVDEGCQVINNSWGGGASRLIWDAIEYCNRHGVVCVFAAGNSGRTEPSYPASWDNNVSTAAIDYNYRRAGFSTGNRSVDFGNFGVRVRSTTNNCNEGDASGTSMAAPHQTGEIGAHIALELANGKQIKRTVVQWNKHLARWVRDLGPPGPDTSYGHGKHNIRSAVEEYEKELKPTPGPDPDPGPDPPGPDPDPGAESELIVVKTLQPGRYEVIKKAAQVRPPWWK